eukprot:TRINITY_DN64667_c0_g1_i1.p1 TRINITY_DN64667_c0_g1~~TRINITY_DN64667_c0_g1_i1.p1  ORF type:complete len:158 (+),score=23.22 TRINITY_DN64667_c0_g1_i1:206-679(+)
MVPPQENQLMLFSGELYHGVMHPFQIPAATRYTLLMNWWTERPMGGIAELPECWESTEDVPQLNCELDGSEVEYAELELAEMGSEELAETQALPEHVATCLDSRPVHILFKSFDWKRSQERMPDHEQVCICLLYTSDAADEEDSVDLGGRRFITKKT